MKGDWLIWIGIGLAVLGVAGVTVAVLVKSRAWPSVPGVMTESEVVEVQRTRRPSEIGPLAVTEYEARIRYTYSVDGVALEGTRLMPLMPSVFPDRDRALAVIAQRPPGAPVEVYYDPNQPSRSALVTMAAIPTRAVVALGVVFSLAAAALITVGYVFRDRFTG
ncbi:MAG: DUF3592 domain-containing protein [Phycisphaerae bacterium]|nr:DUF3592 domain-containing protein [Phycisphaerae bacterium]